MRHSPIELNDKFKEALALMEDTSKNIFITGKAGTGKSTLLSYFRNQTRKNVVVLAPTGVAALNVQGQTIHSFFRFRPDIAIDKVKKLSSRRPVQKKHIFVDWRVVSFVTRYQYQLSEKNLPLAAKVDLIKNAIEKKKPLEIVYLKTNDEKSRRKIVPSFIGELTYQEKVFLGVQAYDSKRREERTFRVDRILEMIISDHEFRAK